MTAEGIRTKDYWTMIALEACGHVPESIEAEEVNEGRSIVIVYVFSDEAKEDYERWMRGVNEPPLDVVRRVQQSANNFKNNLHRFNCR